MRNKKCCFAHYLMNGCGVYVYRKKEMKRELVGDIEKGIRIRSKILTSIHISFHYILLVPLYFLQLSPFAVTHWFSFYVTSTWLRICNTHSHALKLIILIDVWLNISQPLMVPNSLFIYTFNSPIPIIICRSPKLKKKSLLYSQLSVR